MSSQKRVKVIWRDISNKFFFVWLFCNMSQVMYFCLWDGVEINKILLALFFGLTKGVSHSRAIIYGSVAVPLGKKEEVPDPSHTHKWTVFVRGVGSEDISRFIKKVTFKLHESFEQPTRGD